MEAVEMENNLLSILKMTRKFGYICFEQLPQQLVNGNILVVPMSYLPLDIPMACGIIKLD